MTLHYNVGTKLSLFDEHCAYLGHTHLVTYPKKEERDY